MESNCNNETDNISMNYTNKSNDSFNNATPALNNNKMMTTQSCNINICDNVKLHYTVHRYSSFSTTYFPDNILSDRPHDQGSRWSAYSNNPPQYLVLRLRRPAIVRTIKFGKFEKSHVCNLKKFRIYGGLSEDSMTLLAEGGLKNDHLPETLILKHTTENSSSEFPILFLKIVPLLSWGPTFHFSIWYVELSGQDDPMLTATTMVEYNDRRESEIIRLCLKHFRQQGYMEAFNALQRQTNVELEHPMITELHELLVLTADYDRTESFLEHCISQGLMDKYLQEQNYRHRWIMQHVRGSLQPGNRGGHQLVMDAKKRLIYLFGGWDGFQDLGDFWVFDLEKQSWTLLYEHTELHGGPTPRSCHRMVFDPISENIFMLGRYLDNSIRTRDYIRSDFYLYDTRQGTWMLISEDTNTENGPKLVHDHQMCIDAEKRTIYVFGGKVLTPRSVTASALSEVEYSGLYSYHIDTNTWTEIFVDCHHPTASQADILSIKSCLSHCMVFNTKNRKLYIYGGNRGKEDIQDFITYDVDTQCLEVLNKSNPIGYLMSDAPNNHEPPTGYTMRATIDCNREEIYVFTSLSKYKDRLLQQLNGFNSFWVYSIHHGTWSRVYTCLGNNLADPNNQVEPCPRFAHQLIYDEVAKEHYLFGGNPGKMHTPELRLDDFWTLQLEKPRREELLQHCRFSVRKLRYKEIARSNPLKAMRYLRKEVAAVVDKNNSKQLSDFHKLAGLVFQPAGSECELLSGDNYEFSVSHLPHISNNNQETTDIEKLESENDSNQTTISTSAYSNSSGFSGSNSPSAAPSPDMWYEIPRNSAQEQKNRLHRCFLFNRLVQLMPTTMIPPEKNLSDFVVP